MQRAGSRQTGKRVIVLLHEGVLEEQEALGTLTLRGPGTFTGTTIIVWRAPIALAA